MKKSFNNKTSSNYTSYWEFDPDKKKLYIKYKFIQASKSSIYINNMEVIKSDNNTLNRFMPHRSVLKENPILDSISIVNDRLAEIILKKDITKVREFFDKEFFAGKCTAIYSGHLKLAIDNNLDDILALFLMRGARFTKGELKTLSKEECRKYKVATYVSGSSVLLKNNRLGFK